MTALICNSSCAGPVFIYTTVVPHPVLEHCLYHYYNKSTLFICWMSFHFIFHRSSSFTTLLSWSFNFLSHLFSAIERRTVVILVINLSSTQSSPLSAISIVHCTVVCVFLYYIRSVCVYVSKRFDVYGQTYRVLRFLICTSWLCKKLWFSKPCLHVHYFTIKAFL